MTEIENYRGYSIEIVQDEIVDNPRVMGEYIGTMVCFHRKYQLGDKNHGFSSLEEIQSFLEYGEEYKDVLEFLDDHPEVAELRIGERYLPFYLPLYLYDHSGITMITGGFQCPWDSSQVGYIFIRREDAEKEWVGIFGEELEERTLECMKAEVEEYDCYIRGEIFGFVIKDENGDRLDSCWEFYGDPEKSGLLEEARCSVDSYIDIKQKEGLSCHTKV